MEKINFEQFLKRVKNKQSVNRFDFEIDFKWGIELSLKLRGVLTNLKVRRSIGCTINFVKSEYEQAKQFIEGLK